MHRLREQTELDAAAEAFRQSDDDERARIALSVGLHPANHARVAWYLARHGSDADCRDHHTLLAMLGTLEINTPDA